MLGQESWDCPNFRVNENGTVPFGPLLDRAGTKIFAGSKAKKPNPKLKPKKLPGTDRERSKPAGVRPDANSRVRPAAHQPPDDDHQDIHHRYSLLRRMVLAA